MTHLTPEQDRIISNGKALQETAIIDGEDGPQVGILIDLPNGEQIWSGDVSKSLFQEQGEIAMDSLGGNDNGVFVMSSNSTSTEIVCRAASVDHGISIARALAHIAAISLDELAKGAETARDKWRHIKRGTEYEIVGNAKVQCAEPIVEREGELLVIYKAHDGTLWARPFGEFYDGRFEPVSSNQGAKTDE